MSSMEWWALDTKEDRVGKLEKRSEIWLCYWAGVDYSRGGTHGKMECMEPTVRFLREGTWPMLFKWRTRLVAFSTSPPLHSTRLLGDLVASESWAVLAFLCLFLLLLGISPCWLGTGSREITLWVFHMVNIRVATQINLNQRLIRDIQFIVQQFLTFKLGLNLNWMG